MLFEVGRGGHAIHLFGGMRPTRIAWSSPRIEAIAGSGDEFWHEVPEIGPEAAASLVPAYGIDPARPLATWLTGDDASRVKVAAEANGVNEAALAALRPWLAAQVLRMAADAHDGMPHANAAEAVLLRRANEAGIPVKSEFATPEDVFAYFGSMPAEAEVQYLRFTLYEIASGLERVERHAAEMNVGSYAPIEEETLMMRDRWPALYAHLVVPRNEAWLPRFEAMFEARTRAFVVVGSGHLVGPDGLLATLPHAGFSVGRATA